jgi:malate synthase
MPKPTTNASQVPFDDGFAVTRPVADEHADILTVDALRFVCALARRFGSTRSELLKLRDIRQREIDARVLPGFLRETASIRSSAWSVTTDPIVSSRLRVLPACDYTLLDRAVRTGGGLVVADFEDSNSPTWSNCVEGQLNLRETAVREPGNVTLAMRPRGWHLDERHLRVDDQPVPAALFDFGLFFFHNARRLVELGRSPFLYLPKLESHLEARLWSEVFAFAQEAMGLPPGTIRVAVLVETILAAFEVDEIVYELRNHCAGIDYGRWDYVFSIIKRFRNYESFVFPDRSRVTMGRRILGACTSTIANVSARRNVAVLCSVAEDRGAVPVTAEDLLAVPSGNITEAGLRTNVNVGITYLESWLRGNGHVEIYGAVEDTATAEVSRAQVWQWIRHAARLSDGRTVTRALVHDAIAEELHAMERSMGTGQLGKGRFDLAAKLFAEMTEADEFPEFMTLLAYGYLD